MLKRITLLLVCLVLLAGLVPQGGAAGKYNAEFIPEAGGLRYAFSVPDREFVCLSYSTRNESGMLTLQSPDGNFSGFLPLIYTQAEGKVSLKVLTPAQKRIFETKVTYKPGKAPAAPSPQKGAVRKVSDLALTPGVRQMGWQFTAPGHQALTLQFSSVMQKGSFTIVPDEAGVFSGVLQVPNASARDLITITIKSLKGSQMARQAERTLFVPPELPETAAEGPLSGVVVCIDPGHQQAPVERKGGEQLMPGSSKIVYSKGGSAQGKITLRRESIAALEISYLLCIELRKMGAQVVMTRLNEETGLTNYQRADIAEQAGAHYMLRIHLNMSKRLDADAQYVYIPDKSPYAALAADRQTYWQYAEALLRGMMEETGVKTGMVRRGDQFVGNNWAKMPVFLIETGFMSAPANDILLAHPVYQQRVALGLAKGVIGMEEIKRGLEH